MQAFKVEKADAPGALTSFPCVGWVKLTDVETGNEAVGAVLHRTGFIRVPSDPTKSAYGIEIDPSVCAETVAAAKALFA